MPVPAGPTSTTFSAASIHSRRGEVVERGPRAPRTPRATKSSSVVVDREARGPATGGLVGGVTGGDLGLDERAQQLLGWPSAGPWPSASTSGASRRTAASLRRFRPASRSGSRAAASGRSRWPPRGHRRRGIAPAPPAARSSVRAGCPRPADPGSGGEDGTHVGGPEAAVGERALEGRDEGLATMGPLELGDDRRARPGSFVVPAAAAARRKASATGPRSRKASSAARPWSHGPGGPPRRAAVVGVDEAHLAGTHEAVAGDLGAAVGDDELGTLDA